MTDYPQGNGDPACPECKGRGVVSVLLHGFPGGGTRNCGCVYRHDLLLNVRRIWKALEDTPSVEQSPLMGRTGENLWITATEFDLRRHLRHVAFRMGPRWDALVVADTTLVTAWLSTAKTVMDPDVLAERSRRNRPSADFATLVDIAVPPELLIVRVGVKSAKNREMPGVLAEAISERSHEHKPTWLVDTPAKPLREGHVCWDGRVEEVLIDWDRLELSSAVVSDGGLLSYATPEGGYFYPTMAVTPVSGDTPEAPPSSPVVQRTPVPETPRHEERVSTGNPAMDEMMATKEEKAHKRKFEKRAKTGWPKHGGDDA